MNVMFFVVETPKLTLFNIWPQPPQIRLRSLARCRIVPNVADTVAAALAALGMGTAEMKKTQKLSTRGARE